MKISAVIPAYNEEKTIGSVLKTLKQVRLVDEILVVNDGSRDNTSQVAQGCGVKVLNLPQNQGKGAAVKAGVDNCKGDIVLLLDADLIGLETYHVNDLIEPVLKGYADMTIGVFRSGRLRTDLAHRISPYLSGQRAVRRSILDSISHLDAAGYGIEIALTRCIERHNIRTQEVVLEDMTHVMKEEKLGFLRGFCERLKMYWHIFKGLKLYKTN